MFDKVIRALDGILDRFVLLICALLLLVGAYSVYDNLHIYATASDAKAYARYRPDMTKTLSEIRSGTAAAEETPPVYVNAEEGSEAPASAVASTSAVLDGQVAWLYVEDTSIDFPVMQGEDNFEYLNKNPEGEFSLSGSIFLDYRSDPTFRDDYSLVYGHHMELDHMFGSLDLFKDETYFEAHRAGTLVAEDAVYEYEIFAVTHADGNDSLLFSPHGRAASEIIEYLRSISVIFREPEPDLRLFAMSTCSGDTFTSRLLVVGTIQAK